MKTFSSVLATTIRDYLTLKRALGREYEREEWVLARLDRFLAARHADLIAETLPPGVSPCRIWPLAFVGGRCVMCEIYVCIDDAVSPDALSRTSGFFRRSIK